MEQISFTPIGIVHSPFANPKDAPRRPKYRKETEGTVEILPQYAEGLEDIEDFSHIYLLCHFHLSHPHRLLVQTPFDTEPHGVFATRSPSRPNPIGLSLVKLIRRKGNTLHVQGLDIVDGTSVLDIKPYIPHDKETQDVEIGWLSKRKAQSNK